MPPVAVPVAGDEADVVVTGVVVSVVTGVVVVVLVGELGGDVFSVGDLLWVGDFD